MHLSESFVNFVSFPFSPMKSKRHSILSVTALVSKVGGCKCLMISALAILLQAACACSIHNPENIEQNSISRIEFKMKDFVPDVATKTTLGDNGVSLKWEAGDVIGVFPDKGGDQVTFTVTEGGATTCTFDGHGWGLLASAKYSAYYPFSFGNYGDADAYKSVNVSYIGQSQSEKNTFSVGRFD